MNDSRDEEQDEKLKELKDKFEEALQRIEELELSGEDSEDSEDSLTIESVDEPPFRVHWIDPSVETSSSCEDIDTVKKAQEAFAEANVYRNANTRRIMHGDILILMCNSASGDDTCYYVGLCVLTNTPNQVEVPASPVITADSGTKEFMAWYTCPSCPECPSSISALGDSSTWTVSLGNCTKFDDLMSVSAFVGSEGTTLTFKKRQFTLNSCGEVIDITAESDVEILVPCCSPWDGDDCPPSADACLTTNGITDVSSYTLTDNSTGLQGHVAGGPYTLIRPAGNCTFWEYVPSGWSMTRSYSGLATPCPNAGVVTYRDPADPLYSKTFYNSGTSSSIPGIYTNASHGSVTIS